MQQRTRVVQVTATLRFGGSEQVASTIGRNLDPTRYEVDFVATGEDGEIGDKLRGDGFQTKALDRQAGFSPSLLWAIFKNIRAKKCDVVQTHHVSSLIYGGIPARILGLRLVHTEHETKTFDRYPRNLRWLRRLRWLVDTFVAIDPEIADYLHIKGGIAREKIVVIRNGIDLGQFCKQNDTTASSEFVIGWVSRLDVPKRPDLLVQAVARLASRYPDLRAKIIGAGTLSASTQKLVTDLGMTDRVAMLGARADVADQLRSMNCYVLCSEREGLPISLVEAMATGLPSIVSAVGSIPTLVEDGKNGLLLPSTSVEELVARIVEIRENAALAQSLGANARQTAVERYDLAPMIRQYDELFSRLTHPHA